MTYKPLFLAIIPSLLLGGLGCQTIMTTRGGVVGVSRQQTMLVSADRVEGTAQANYGDVLKDATAAGKLNQDRHLLKRVRAITTRLVPQTGVFRDDAPGWHWDVNVITAKTVNAWCMPGGRIVVYTGIVAALKLTDAELAAILGHEIGHALREHARERMSQTVGVQVGAKVIGAVAGAKGEDLGMQFGQVFFLLPNSREGEQESDRIGVELAARAGYDPRAAVSVWKKMAALGSKQPPEFLSTHPSHESRIKDLQGYSELVMPLYKVAIKKR